MSIVIAIAQTYPHLHVLFAWLVILVPQGFVSLLKEALDSISSDCVVCGGIFLKDRHCQCKIMLGLFVVVSLRRLCRVRNRARLIIRSGRCRLIWDIRRQWFFIEFVGARLPVAGVTGWDVFIRSRFNLTKGLTVGCSRRSLNLISLIFICKAPRLLSEYSRTA